jgi:hypothetical protein
MEVVGEGGSVNWWKKRAGEESVAE